MKNGLNLGSPSYEGENSSITANSSNEAMPAGLLFSYWIPKCLNAHEFYKNFSWFPPSCVGLRATLTNWSVPLNGCQGYLWEPAFSFLH
jgi:hypothetical protein